MLGAYYFDEGAFLHDFVDFSDGLLQIQGPNHITTENHAVFGQVDWRLNQLIGLTAGVRYTSEDKNFLGAQTTVA